MKQFKLVVVACLVAFGSLPAKSLRETLDHLGVQNPEFLVHIDVKDDFNSLGSLLTQLYMEYLKTGPETPPIPISFDLLFERLGFNNLDSMTISSERTADGFLNQSLTQFDGKPEGIFNLLGESNQPFAILDNIPEDADLIAESTMDIPVLLDVIRYIAADVMGPMGQGLIDAQLSQPINEDGLTILDLINQLDTRIQIAASFPEEAPEGMPGILAILNGRAAMRLEGIGQLLGSLSPMLQGMGFTTVPDSNGSVLQMVIPNDVAPVSITLEALEGTNDLLVYFSEDSRDWFIQGKPLSGDIADLMESNIDFPKVGLSFWYDSGKLSKLQIEGMWNETNIDEKYAPMLGIVEAFLLNFTGPQLAVTFVEDSSQRAIALQPASYKTNVAIAALVIPVGMGIGFSQAIEEAATATEEPLPDPTD